jgi:arylsulfatase
MKARFWAIVVGGLVAKFAFGAPPPDVVLILVDDMGYSDIGSFGGEIPTPHLDALAARGVRFPQFYNAARCSPTRAALLTGRYPHEVGMGILAEDQVQRAEANAGPGYRRYLDPAARTLAEALREAGYATALVGKWHLGFDGEEKRPLAHGFDEFYGLLSGSSSYHRPAEPRPFTRGTEMLPPPEDASFYATDVFGDEAVRFLRERGEGERFFLYLSFTAPHWPLHAREEDIAKFVGKYAAGWDVVREARHARLIELGVVPEGTALAPRDAGVRAWDRLTAKEKVMMDYRMAVYAAQMFRMDEVIGRVVAELRSLGREENTLVMFLSDNGASAEPYTEEGGGTFEAVNRPDALGLGSERAPTRGSSYGMGWANASNTPFRRFKSQLYEGGVATPLIVSWPAGQGVEPGSIDRTPGHVIDVMPTVMELVTGETSVVEGGTPWRARSLASRIVTPERSTEPRTFGWEQYGHRAMRIGDWKAVRDAATGAAWELYDLASDPTELHDRAATEPERVAELVAAWERWAAETQVFPVTQP